MLFRSAVSSPPVQLADGTVVVGSWDNYVYFLSPDGTLKARYQTGGAVSSSPVQLADGTVVVGSDDKHVYFLDPAQMDEWNAAGGTP